MGFLDGLLSTVGGILGAVGGPVGIGVGASLGSTAASLLGGGGVPSASQQLGVTTAGIVGGPLGGGIQSAISAADGGQRMKNRVITRVQTLNPANEVIREKVLMGAPFLMQKDFQIARRVIKLSKQAAARVPKKVIKQTVGAMLNEAIKSRALAEVTNGHNGGNGIQLTAPLTAG